MAGRTESWRETTPLASRLDDILLVLALLAALAASWRFADYAYDDAYITYRYAKNIAAGHGFVYNLGQDHLGTTTPLYTLLLGGLGLVFDIPTASGWISVASLLGCILFLELIGRHAGIRFAGPLAGLLLFLNPAVYWMFGGETVLAYFLLVPLAFWLERTGRGRAGAAVFGLAVLARMDAAIFVALVYAVRTLRERRVPWPRLAVFTGVLAPWVVYAQIVFGHPLPSTLGVKMAQGASGYYSPFLEGVLRSFEGLAEYELWIRWITLPLLVLGLVRIVLVERVWIFFLLHSVLFAVAYGVVLGVPLSHWYLANTFVSHALLLGAGVRQLVLLPSRLERLAGPGRPARRAASALIALLLLAAGGTYVVEGVRRTLAFQVHPPRRRLYTRLGHWLRERTPPDATVAFFEVGYVGYYSERTIIDRVGLVTPGGEESIRRRDDGWAFRRYEPDYYIQNTKFSVPRFIGPESFLEEYELVEVLHQEGYPGDAMIFRRTSS